MDDRNLTNQSLHSKIGQLIGHFVDFQKTLESQNQKQRTLGEILVELTTQFEKEKSFSREPQNETQNVGQVQQAKQSDSGQVSPQSIYSIPGLSDIIKEVRIRLKGLDQKTDLIQNNLFGTCDDVSSSSISGNLRGLKTELEQVNTSITYLAGRLETVETRLATVVGKIGSVETFLNDGHETVKEDLQKSMVTVVQKIESVKTSLNDGHKTVKEDLQKNMATVVQKIKSVETSLNDGHKTVKEDFKKSMTTVVQNIESFKTSLNDEHKTVKRDLLSLKQRQDLMTTKIEQSIDEVKDDIYGSKREIFAFTEKEAQIVRDRIEGPLPSLGKYSFDFYVQNFKTLVRSGKQAHSPPWHINEAKTSMAGQVSFQADGNILVLFVHGRHSREVGLQPRPTRTLRVRATICGGNNKVLPDIVVGEGTGPILETVTFRNGDWGQPLGLTSDDDLIKNGYGEKEGYWEGAILIRYDVTVLL